MKDKTKELTERHIESAITKSRKHLCSLMRAHMKKNKISLYALGLLTGIQPNHIRKKLMGGVSMDLGTFLKLTLGLKLHFSIDATGDNGSILSIGLEQEQEKVYCQAEVNRITEELKAQIEIQKAESQMIGYNYAKQGYSILDLVSAMGLRSAEWESIKENYRHLPEKDVKEIDALFLEKEVYSYQK